MLVHGWVLDNQIEDDGSSYDITARGIAQMHDCIDDESVAVLYNRNQFKILHKVESISSFAIRVYSLYFVNPINVISAA